MVRHGNHAAAEHLNAHLQENPNEEKAQNWLEEVNNELIKMRWEEPEDVQI